MAEKKHPYSPGPGGITAAINQFQKSFPKTVTSETLKKLGIAPKNESYVINVLRFIGAIDAEGNKTEAAGRVFSKSGEDFQKDFELMIRDAYVDLFALYTGDAAWTLPPDKLKAFFRHSDQSTDLVGQLQATTFQRLAAFAGHGQIQAPPQPKSTTKPSPAKPVPEKFVGHAKTNDAAPATLASQKGQSGDTPRDVGLTVRIEVNLPSGGDQETYDRIFRSIRENLLNGK
jgi:hypothetical protein